MACVASPPRCAQGDGIATRFLVGLPNNKTSPREDEPSGKVHVAIRARLRISRVDGLYTVARLTRRGRRSGSPAPRLGHHCSGSDPDQLEACD